MCCNACTIIGAADSSIREPVPNRLEVVLEAAPHSGNIYYWK
jgi:hypothetical protein